MEFLDIGAMIPIVAIAASVAFAYIWLRYHELKVQGRADSREKMALEDRVRVLEKILTDRGVETAAQIEALREHARIPSGEHTT